MGKNNEGLSEYLYLLPFLAAVVYAIITIWYNPYHLIDNGGTKAMGIAMVLQIGVSILVAIITGIFSVYAVRSQRRYRRLEEALGNILEKGTLTEQHSRMGQSLTEQHNRIGRSLGQITGNTGEYGNLTAQHSRIAKEVKSVDQQVAAISEHIHLVDQRNQNLSSDARHLTEAVAALNAFQDLMARQAQLLDHNKEQIMQLKQEIQSLTGKLEWEKTKRNKAEEELRDLQSQLYQSREIKKGKGLDR